MKRKFVNIQTDLWLNGWVFVYELSGCGFEPSCSYNITLVNFEKHIAYLNEPNIPLYGTLNKITHYVKYVSYTFVNCFLLDRTLWTKCKELQLFWPAASLPIKRSSRRQPKVLGKSFSEFRLFFLYPGRAVTFLQLQEDNVVNYSTHENQIASSIKLFSRIETFWS